MTKHIRWQAVGPVAVTSLILANKLPAVSRTNIPGQVG